jgi:hypothetical protein
MEPIRNYLKNSGHAVTDKNLDDPQTTLKKLVNTKDGNPDLILPRMLVHQVQLVMESRNRTAHLNLDIVDEKWDGFVSSWILLAEELNCPVEAQNLRHYHDRMLLVFNNLERPNEEEVEN